MPDGGSMLEHRRQEDLSTMFTNMLPLPSGMACSGLPGNVTVPTIFPVVGSTACALLVCAVFGCEHALARGVVLNGV